MKRKEPDASQNKNIVSGIFEEFLNGIPLDSNSKMSPENKYAVPVTLGAAEVVNLDKTQDNVTTSSEGVDSTRILQKTTSSQDECSTSIAIPITDQANSNHVSASSNQEMCPSKESNQPEGKYCQFLHQSILLKVKRIRI